MERQVKILQINSGSKEFGGVSSILFNIFEKIDKKKFTFDFLTPEFTTYNLRRKEIEHMGGKIFEFKITKKKLGKLISVSKKICDFLNKNHYDIVHINSGSFLFNLFVSLGVRFSKSKPVIVIHSHNSLEKKVSIKNFIIKILNPLLLFTSDYQVACSLKAAEAMFPTWYSNKVKIFYNAVDLNRFDFTKNERIRIRNNLDVSDDTVLIGNIGRLSYQKNQLFLLKIIKILVQNNKNISLVIIGQGPEEENLKKFVENNHLENNVHFISETNDVNSYYSAFDLFVLTSLYEGLPLVGVEAQATGLSLVLSEAITKEVNITGNVTFLKLSNIQQWVSSIEKIKINHNRLSNKQQLISSGYMIDDVVNSYEKFYSDILKEDKND
ncbi:MAG: glycosyltransferase [Enterococcus gallinarum]